MSDAKNVDAITITVVSEISTAVLPAEVMLIKAHLGDLLLKVLMLSEEE